jgi:hypothetical protein
MKAEFYIYVHLRADSGLPFYIGKGKGMRAYNQDRTTYWKRVAKKHGVIVEILHLGLTEEEAFEREIEEIAWAKQYYSLVNIREGGEGGVWKSTQSKKELLYQFYKENKRLPDWKTETALFKLLTIYTSPSSPCYDVALHTWAKKCGWGNREGSRYNKREKQEAVREFYRQHGRFPSQCRKTEVRLYKWLNYCCSPSSLSYSQDFHTWAKSVGYGNHNKTIWKEERK